MQSKPIEEYPDLLDVQDVMEILRVGRISIYKYIQSGALAAKKIAGKYRIPKESLISFSFANSNEQRYNNMRENSDALE